MPSVATAHGTEVPPEPDVGAMLLGWTFEPLVAIPLAAAGLLWRLAVRRVNAAHPTNPVPRERSALFGFALQVSVLTL